MAETTMKKGSKLRVHIAQLRPTQMTIGSHHVKCKMVSTRKVPDEEREAFFDKHRIHVVLGPDATVYIVDHHHWARAWHDVGIDSIPVIVRKDLSHASWDKFWDYMLRRHLVHPYDEHGKRRQLEDLPLHVADMRDDPYRSLEAFAQIAGGYLKVKEAYPDFKWADFFRRQIKGPIDTTESFALALANSVKLARSKKARGLPGYIGE
ncbi:ParB/Srx family N-terminal domain-containing protein [Cupriavidus respiraculi]|uniref:ParB/Srx family N-terminal domain-containing protein n=1 Tax=Cupriavidus respiraculi TaxID=195930 RepID=UPI001C9563B0|nr:ParB/Srx family N-terminal domain-containing protein [Cupriavidus respiraculi]MBY4948636.1 ParB/Srx family N-terminal domain-containing protein [Cupriavidus respiraculi]